jgi:hypothetical protein
MAIVSRGLGLPEDGAIVAAGLGVTEQVPGAMTATLAGVGTLTAALTYTGGAEPDTGLSGPRTAVRIIPPKFKPPRHRKPLVVVGHMTARLTGTGTLTAELGFEIRFRDQDLEQLLILDLV